MASAVAKMSATCFCLTGRFLTFLPGGKSPYQRLLLETVLAENPFNPESSSGPVEYQIVLGKDLRRMMYRYLEPQDWVRVVGRRSLNRRSGLIEWKAAEISKLSSAQVDQLKHQTTLPAASKSSKPIRVLICQKSDCRQRGSLAVSQAMESAILQRNDSAAADASSSKIVIQATGCMKRCQAGPNVVMLPGGVHTRVTPDEGRSLVQSVP